MERWRLEQERRDYRSGIIASILANTNRKKGAKAYKVTDFMPHHQERPQKPLSVQQSINFVAMLNAAFGGVDKRAKA